MRSLVLKALSHSLQVEFTYIKSGETSEIHGRLRHKNPSAHSLPPSLCFPLSFSLYHTDSSACSWLLMCGSGAGWRTYCSINHVPILCGDARDSEGRLRQRPRSVSPFLVRNARVTNILQDPELHQNVHIPIS